MAENMKPLCKFGEKCYRKNPQHLQSYRHPKRKSDEHAEGSKPKKQKVEEPKKGRTIDSFFKKKEPEHAISDEEEEIPDTPDFSKAEPDDDQEPEAVPASSSHDVSEEEEEEDPDIEVPDSPGDVKESIKQKFLVEMPEDFYQFWKFCEQEKPASPKDALKDCLGLELVGAFDILAGTHKGVTKNRHGRRPNFLLHWRYYYDPPEFQTVIRGDNKTQFHIGYFRDDPKESPSFVAFNSAKTNCIISAKGDNLFAAINYLCEDKIKSKDTSSAQKEQLKALSAKLKSEAETHGHSLDLKTKRMKERDKKVVCKSFHGAGIVVPVDENEVGYREVPETPADLKKIFKKIADSKTESERDKNYEDLQELVTLIQFANDECDYGEGLELGMDLFCYGGAVFHTTIGQLMPLAYMLLGRTEFQTIIEAHLKQRSQLSDLSQLT